MIGDCNHRNFLLWNCTPGWIIGNGTDQTKRVSFNRSVSHTLEPVGLKVLEVYRKYDFNCRIFNRLGGPWICDCDGQDTKSRGPGFHPYVNIHQGSVSENYSVTRRTIKFLDARSGIVAYSENTQKVVFSASSNVPVGKTQMMGPGDKWMWCYVDNMISFKNVAITTTSQTSEFVMTPSGLITVSTGKINSSTKTHNLMLGLFNSWVGVQIGDWFYSQVQFKDYYNWDETDRDNYYSGFWCQSVMAADDPTLGATWDGLQISPATGKPQAVSIDPNIDNRPVGSWVTDMSNNIFISQMSEVDSLPFNYIKTVKPASHDIPISITISKQPNAQPVPIPAPAVYYPIAPV